MNGITAYGFCDLNISSTENNIKETVIQALKLGYETVALNRNISDEVITSKKNKKGTYAEIPPPIKFALSHEELKKYGITKKPVIFSRLTIKFSQPSSPFLHKSKDVIRKYDIIAYSPMTENAFKHLCQSNVDVDMISFDIYEAKYRPSRKLLLLAVKTDIYFEICYGPCIRSSDSRQKTLQLAHDLHSLSRSLNVIITSEAQYPSELRNPYDVANLGLLFGLTPAGSKGAVSKTASDMIHCAKMRRTGGNKCSAQVEILKKPSKKGKYSTLLDLETLVDNS